MYYAVNTGFGRPLCEDENKLEITSPFPIPSLGRLPIALLVGPLRHFPASRHREGSYPFKMLSDCPDTLGLYFTGWQT
jgi:hypothetical protein